MEQQTPDVEALNKELDDLDKLIAEKDAEIARLNKELK